MSDERKVVVVTGASQGLGEAFVKAYRERGWRAVGNGRSIAASAHPDYITVAGDVGDPEVARRVIEVALTEFGRVDTLINNAGIWRPGPIADIPEEQYRRVMATNVDSVFFATQAAVPAMRRQGGGHILQVSTSLVEHALQNVPAVLASLSKGAVVAATRGLAMELARDNIRVNAVSLGIVRTPLHEPESLEGKRSFAPLNRVGEIVDVVRAVNYLEDADFVTGEISYIDGGRTAGH
ncbi:SDR family oxidoreductase [Streptomyces sp. MI02-2A]|uniref:SDR family NAD(P)-dependent oxidoreductase n=1 Tax=unclassified Streptomyces TaxID=2593676 RepID=UPI000E24D0D7|nr:MULTISPECIES: SDR family oxidoreductase [unclassified Streptomyces]MDX3265872.1 SDR family oxidoreductase [Streptomyces sp. MI02-2A]REE64009.1 NAD(P)-dependent dehydrogenase (short-subunit alcohol dehydrogenase family) [Streptomyces sp. 3212.3]